MVKIHTGWMYLGWTVDRDGQTLDLMLSEKRDKATATRFVASTLANNGILKRIVIDISRANRAGIKEEDKNLKRFNTAYRANELLSLTIGQVDHLGVGDVLEFRQSKSGKHRSVALNRTVVEVIENWLKVHPETNDDAPLFWSRKTRKTVTVSAVNRQAK